MESNGTGCRVQPLPPWQLDVKSAKLVGLVRLTFSVDLLADNHLNTDDTFLTNPRQWNTVWIA